LARLLQPFHKSDTFFPPYYFSIHWNQLNNPEDGGSPPYSPGLAPVPFYLFPGLKSALKVWRFCAASDLIKNATEELKMLSPKASMNISDTLTVAGRYLVA